MKNTKKKVFAIALVVALFATVSLGSLAWFSADDTATNTFMIASSNDTEKDVFSIDIYEMKDTDGDGVGDARVDGIVYGADNEVTPGAELSKEAYVANTGRYDQYARVFVTLSDVTKWMDVLGVTGNNTVDLTRFFKVAANFDTTWYRNDAETVYDQGADTLTYVYYYNGVLEAGDTAEFLQGVKLPGEGFDVEDVIRMGGSFELNFVAEAVQSVNMLDPYGTVEYQNAIDSFAMI